MTGDAPAIDHDAPGSALRVYLADRTARKHPAQIVFESLAAGRRIQLPDGRTYLLSGNQAEFGTEPGHRLSAGEFVRLCERLSANQVFEIGLDVVLARLGTRARQRRRRRS